jgi:hypothetical protein
MLWADLFSLIQTKPLAFTGGERQRELKKFFNLTNQNYVIMMKVINFCSIFLLLLLASCKPDGVNGISPIINNNVSSNNTESAKEKKMKYKIDGKEMSKEAFYGSFTSLLSKANGSLNTRSSSESDMLEVISETNKIIAEIDRPESDGIFNVTNAFTNTDSYIEYAEASGYQNVAVIEQAYSDIAEYADAHGIEEEVEATGVIPDYFITYMNSYLVSHELPISDLKESTTKPVLQERSLFNTVWTECAATGNSWILRRNPCLILFNNKITSFTPIGFIGGRTDIFDKWFYKRHLVGVWSWAQNNWSLCTSAEQNSPNPFGDTFNYANNAASSWFSF